MNRQLPVPPNEELEGDTGAVLGCARQTTPRGEHFHKLDAVSRSFAYRPTRRVWLAPEVKRRNKLIWGAIGTRELQARLSAKTRQIVPRVPFRHTASHETCRRRLRRHLCTWPCS